MSVDLSALSNASLKVESITSLILVSPQNKGIQPQPKTGTTQEPTFLFNYEGENTVTLESDITDHYTENNSPIEDQIALKPIMVTTQGYIGELNNVTPDLLLPLKLAADKLQPISAYTPSLSLTALIVYNNAFAAYQLVKSAASSLTSVWNSLFGDGNATEQQKAFVKFLGYWQNRTLFTVQTPWATFPNMALKSVRAIQDGETKVVSTFEVEFKQMKFASTSSSFAFNGQPVGQDRYNAQTANQIDNGVQFPPTSTNSLTDFPGLVA